MSSPSATETGKPSTAYPVQIEDIGPTLNTTIVHSWYLARSVNCFETYRPRAARSSTHLLHHTAPWPTTFRNALRKGGLNQPLVAVPTDYPRTFFLVGQFSHLHQVSAAYNRYANVVRSRIANLPTINVSESAPLVSFAINLSESKTLYRQMQNENNRLYDTTFAGKRYFLETLISAAKTIIEHITTHVPAHPLVAEHETITALLRLSTTMPQQQ